MPSDDESKFMEIVNANELEEFMAASESKNLTVKEIILGLRDISEASMYLTDFIAVFLSAVTEDEETLPFLSIDSSIIAQELFSVAQKFCDSIVDEDDDEDEEEA